MEKLAGHNRRSLDSLSAKCYYYYARVYELLGQLASIRRFVRLITSTRACRLPMSHGRNMFW